MLGYTRRLLVTGVLLTGGVLATAYLVGRNVPAPLPVARVALAEAEKAALAAVGGGQVLTAAPTVRGGRAVYGFTIRSATGRLWSVAVDQQSARVIRLPVRLTGAAGLKRAEQVAAALIPGGRAVWARVVPRGPATMDVVSVTGPRSIRELVWVAAASGAVVRVVQDRPGSPVAMAGGRSLPGGSGPVSAAVAGKIAVQAVGGGHVLSVTRSELSDRGTFTYTVKVLLPTSSRADVKVAETGAVLRVRKEDGS